MLTAEGCRGRRQRLLDRLRPAGPLVLADPLHLRYLAGLYVDPFSLSADYGAVLVVRPDGHAALHHDGRLPKPAVAAAHADDKQAVPWYDGKSAGHGPRRLSLHPVVAQNGGRVHDALGDPLAADVWNAVTEFRRAKDPDEVAALRACMRAGEVGQAWARRHAKPGMTELDVYLGIFAAVAGHVGEPAVLYGDFAVSPGSARRGGPPTGRAIAAGEMLILDFSVVLGGYRSDFTNTLVVGADPTPDQQRLFDLSVQAMAAGEGRLKAGTPCLDVYKAVRAVFEAAGVAAAFPHHAGHGLGLSHPEAPFFVESASEALVAGDVVTLEPGLYVDGVGGLRVEHNYLITADGFDRLSDHAIALK